MYCALFIVECVSKSNHSFSTRHTFPGQLLKDPNGIALVAHLITFLGFPSREVFFPSWGVFFPSRGVFFPSRGVFFPSWGVLGRSLGCCTCRDIITRALQSGLLPPAPPNVPPLPHGLLWSGFPASFPDYWRNWLWAPIGALCVMVHMCLLDHNARLEIFTQSNISVKKIKSLFHYERKTTHL